MAEIITASVGKTSNGTKECYNVPKDQLAVIRLLNAIRRSEGGRMENPLPINPRQGISVPGLYQAIIEFQRRYPGLSVDGHVDPGGPTLTKLNQVALKPAPAASPAVAGPIRSCTLAASSAFTGHPQPMLETICRSYKAHVANSTFMNTLPGAFQFGMEVEPADFNDVLSKAGTPAIKKVYDRMSVNSGFWGFIDLIYHAWSDKNDGFNFATKDGDTKRAMAEYMDKAPNFARDTKVGQLMHQQSDGLGSKILAPDHQCWREVINGSPGLHVCLSLTSQYENSVHVDAVQVVKGKTKDGYCDYDMTTDFKHMWHERDIIFKTLNPFK